MTCEPCTESSCDTCPVVADQVQALKTKGDVPHELFINAAVQTVQGGHLTVKAASRLFGVTGSTIRKALK